MHFLSPSTLDYSSQISLTAELRITEAHHRSQMTVEGNDRFLSTATRAVEVTVQESSSILFP